MSNRPQSADARFPLPACLAGAGAAMLGACLLLIAIKARLAPDLGWAALDPSDGDTLWECASFVLTMGALGFLTAPAMAGGSEPKSRG